ncbi:ABC transporter substrate-binding protein [Aminobacter sp. DSM 101952]|uniref:ectoine/hydroxyectoine ABC transporter substrate-binding protein EhuB n=1 Tax=Aminobacter sp. DSM 101952 TaxID=2735891 RepID=UPI0006F3010D|nr:ectoine/hydroxyectoine ABC transporter substrate-binding protein EhuB [Aminobacter sp. DSM 101952]KQU74490.1 ABC transporter substrate-binding protein [Aminobacter sp. DSM 101952]
MKAGSIQSTILAIAIALSAVQASLVSAEAAGARERMLEERKLVIGIHNRKPWGYRDEQSKQPSGWHPDLLKAAFAGDGIELDIRVTEFGALIPGLLAGRFDAIASGLAITPERCKQVAFATPDLKVPDAAIVLSGNPKRIHGYADIATNADTIMGAGRGSSVVKNATSAGVSDAQMLLFPDIEANVSALRAGRIDVAVFSSPTVIGLLAGRGAIGLERAVPFETSDDKANFAAIAFRLEDADLRDMLDERLARLRADGTLTKLMENYGFGTPETVPAGITAASLCSR